MNLAIYGAQGIAMGAYTAIHDLFPARMVECFIVTKRENNAESLAGLPVVELALYADSLSEAEKKQVEILIATPENLISAFGRPACGLP